MIAKKILITGVTGFLGNGLYNKLFKKGYKVFGITKSENSINNFYYLNLLDNEKTITFFKNNSFDIIYHLASYVNLSRDYDTFINCINNNLIGTMNLIEALKNIKIEKLIFASTEEIYGNNNTPYVEEMEGNPPSGYALSKLCSEQLLRTYSKNLGRVSVIRFSTIYGPFDLKKRFIPQIIINALNNDDIKISSGDFTRDYLYIEDAVNLLINLINFKQKNYFEIYNAGLGVDISLDYILAKILKFTSSKSNIIRNSYKHRIGEAPKWLMNISKLNNALGWTPKIKIDKGLENTVKYFRSINH